MKNPLDKRNERGLTIYMSDTFTKKDLQEALKKAGLSWSYKAILKYERAGIISKPKTTAYLRLYSREEIDNIVKELRNYFDNK